MNSGVVYNGIGTVIAGTLAILNAGSIEGHAELASTLALGYETYRSYKGERYDGRGHAIGGVALMTAFGLSEDTWSIVNSIKFYAGSAYILSALQNPRISHGFKSWTHFKHYMLGQGTLDDVMNYEKENSISKLRHYPNSKNVRRAQSYITTEDIVQEVRDYLQEEIDGWQDFYQRLAEQEYLNSEEADLEIDGSYSKGFRKEAKFNREEGDKSIAKAKRHRDLLRTLDDGGLEAFADEFDKKHMI